MIALFLLLATVAGLLIFPGWRWANQRHPQSYWFCFLPAGGLSLWVLLTVAGFGAQSLANVVETFVVAISVVIIVYFKFFVFDRRSATRTFGAFFAVAVVVLVVVLLRAFMPLLTE